MKKIIISSIILLSTVLITVFILKSMNIKNNNTNHATIIDTTNATKKRAIDAMQKGDDKTAKILLEQALVQYEESNDTTNIVDTKALLYFVDRDKNSN